MPLTLRLDAAPVSEPIALSEARAHLRQVDTSEDTLISALIVAARERAEEFCHRALMLQYYTLFMDIFPKEGFFRLPRAPLINVLSIKYYATDGTLTVLDPSLYWVDAVTEPARVIRSFGSVWPIVQIGRINAVQAAFSAGYGDLSEEVPQSIRLAMLQMIAHWFENREAVNIGNIVTEVPLSAERLLWPYRMLGI